MYGLLHYIHPYCPSNSLISYKIDRESLGPGQSHGWDLPAAQIVVFHTINWKQQVCLAVCQCLSGKYMFESGQINRYTLDNKQWAFLTVLIYNASQKRGRPLNSCLTQTLNSLFLYSNELQVGNDSASSLLECKKKKKIKSSGDQVREEYGRCPSSSPVRMGYSICVLQAASIQRDSFLSAFGSRQID